MRVFICGIDGYLGHSLACHLMASGHEVAGLDAGLRRTWVAEVGSASAIPILTERERIDALKDRWPNLFSGVAACNMMEYGLLVTALERFRPDAVVHLAEMPSAPYSMIDRSHAAWTMRNNVVGSLNLLYAMQEVCPEAHLVKLGTMGEYGTPGCAIPEGNFPQGSEWTIPGPPGVNVRGVEVVGDLSGLPFPRAAGSWYHQTKVHDTHNTTFACKIWGLRSTDIMQGVVYGTYIDAFGNDERLRTRFDFDECFGTAINRFCAQAVIGHPLTVYGSGEQKRGFLPLKDSMQCLTLVIENPPAAGEYRVFNQFEEVYSIRELAEMVQNQYEIVSGEVSLIDHLPNPRVEAASHYYEPDHQGLFDLGYVPTRNMAAELRQTLSDLHQHKDRIEQHREAIAPKTLWTGEKPQKAEAAD